MKAICSLMFVALLSLCAMASVQPGAQQSFTALKGLAGEWEGTVTTTPPEATVQGKLAHVSLRVTSMGNALLHELRIPGRDDDPISMLYLDEDRLLLTHYCDAGNRPRMMGKMMPGGKAIEFSLIDMEGGTHHGHMHNAAFTAIDPNHHVEEWTFMLPGKGSVLAHFDLQRKMK